METQIYLFRYFFNNSWWSLEIPATSKEEAEERLKCFTTAEYDGELDLVLQVPTTN